MSPSPCGHNIEHLGPCEGEFQIVWTTISFSSKPVFLDVSSCRCVCVKWMYWLQTETSGGFLWRDVMKLRVPCEVANWGVFFLTNWMTVRVSRRYVVSEVNYTPFHGVVFQQASWVTWPSKIKYSVFLRNDGIHLPNDPALHPTQTWIPSNSSERDPKLTLLLPI